MIYILFLFLTILFAVPKVLLPGYDKSTEPYYSVKYSFGWLHAQPASDNNQLVIPAKVNETIDEDTLKLESWMVEPKNWKINDEI